MSVDLSLLRINKVIIHAVPRRLARAGVGNDVVYSEVESPIDAELKLLFQNRIRKAILSQYAFDVQLNRNADTPVPGFVWDYVSGQEKIDFVAMTKVMAKCLYDTQSGVNPDGLLTVVDCMVDRLPALCIMKFEREIGARVQQTEHQGRATFGVELIRDIMFTDKTRLYKLGLFVRTCPDPCAIRGWVSDEQRSNHHTIEVAAYFLKKFLGCELTLVPSVATSRFVDSTERFINSVIADPIRKAQCMNHLVSELTSQKTIISPRTFAENYLEAPERDQFINFIAEQVTADSFPKDLQLVEPRIKKKVLEFASGIQIIGNQEDIDNRVRLSAVEEHLTRAEIVDELKEIRTKRK